MSNSCNKKKTNLMKSMGTLLVLVVFGYYSYQDTMNRRMLEKSLNENAAPPQRDFSYKSSRLKSSSVLQRNASYKKAAKEMYNVTSDYANNYDTFNEHLDEYLEDPEDEIIYPPEIYDALADDEEEEL